MQAAWFIPAVMLLGGLLLLATAADRFVVSAARLARFWGLSPVLVGALVVGMGTSSPELLVSLMAARSGELDLAIGNAIGSNVANVTLVVGATACVTKLPGDARVLRREGVVMFVAVCVFAATLVDAQVERMEGIGLLALMAAATGLVVRWARSDATVVMPVADKPVQIRWPLEVVVGLITLALTLLGAELLVCGGASLAAQLGVDSAFVGLTLVAIGTSLPELATSVAGARRGEHELVIGNVIGSNLFNALAVAGSAAALNPGVVSSTFRTASAFMIGSAALAGVLAYTGRAVVRWEGIVLLAGFAGFVYLSYIS